MKIEHIASKKMVVDYILRITRYDKLVGTAMLCSTTCTSGVVHALDGASKHAEPHAV